MARRSPVLLVGNGLNRAANLLNSPAWDSLVEELGRRAHCPGLNLTEKALPLAFEEILGSCRGRNGLSEREVKRIAAEQVGYISRSPIHERLTALPVKHILTTNYDYALQVKGAGLSSTPERKFSLFRATPYLEADVSRIVWNIHGEAQHPDTLLLGHDHYVRYAGRILEYLRRREKPTTSTRSWSVSDATSPLTIGNLDFERDPKQGEPPHFSWVDLLLTRDVHIVGLGLDFSEVILWWLLTVRSRKEEQLKHGLEIDRSTSGQVTWWECGPRDESPRFRARREVAEALGVNVRYQAVAPSEVAVDTNADYREAWLSQIDALEAELVVVR